MVAGLSERFVPAIGMSLVGCKQRAVRTCQHASLATQAAGGVHCRKFAALDLHDGARLAGQPSRAGSAALAERRFDVEDRSHASTPWDGLYPPCKIECKLAGHATDFGKKQLRMRWMDPCPATLPYYGRTGRSESGGQVGSDGLRRLSIAEARTLRLEVRCLSYWSVLSSSAAIASMFLRFPSSRRRRAAEVK